MVRKLQRMEVIERKIISAKKKKAKKKEKKKKQVTVGIKNDKVSFVLRKSVFLFRGLHMMFFHVSKGWYGDTKMVYWK